MHATVQESGLAQTNPTQALHARCCIVGGGPAGVMLGFLLARVGINLAIQDAVAAANILAPLLSRGKVTAMELRAVQRRRELPTRMTQGLQVFMHRRFLGPAIGGQILTGRPPLLLRMLHRFPRLRRVPARIVGLGFRPEHIRTADSTPR